MITIFGKLLLIYEMGSDRFSQLEKSGRLAKQIVTHLMKVLRWQDRWNYNKHVKDISNWIIDSYNEVSNLKNIRPERFKVNYDTSYSDISKIVKKEFRNYGRLTMTKYSELEISEIITEVIDKMCKDFSNNRDFVRGEFSVLEYFPKDVLEYLNEINK